MFKKKEISRHSKILLNISRGCAMFGHFRGRGVGPLLPSSTNNCTKMYCVNLWDGWRGKDSNVVKTISKSKGRRVSRFSKNNAAMFQDV